MSVLDVATQAAKWSALQSHLNTEYHLPDLAALEIVCTAVTAHKEKPLIIR